MSQYDELEYRIRNLEKNLNEQEQTEKRKATTKKESTKKEKSGNEPGCEPEGRTGERSEPISWEDETFFTFEGAEKVDYGLFDQNITENVLYTWKGRIITGLMIVAVWYLHCG